MQIKNIFIFYCSDNGYVSNYWYDASGERTVKMSGGSEGVAINGVPSVARTETKRFTAYISPYLTVRNGGEYTKHVYMGNERITSKVSNSEIFGTSPVNDTLQAKYQLQTGKIKERFDTLGVKYNGSTQLGGLISNSPSSAEGSYFYHSDHLGSSSLITSQLGDIVQHLEYVPFGETFIDQRNGSWNTPYLFNGKERDEETGLLYVHARYQDSKYGIWYSVDPLAEKYPNVGSYVYCHNNPVNMIDPDGMADYYTNQGKWLGANKNTDNLAYTASSVTKDKNGIVTGSENDKLLPITNSELQQQAATVYGESSAYKSGKTDELKNEMYAIASVYQRNDEAYGGVNPQANSYRSKTNEERNGSKMEFAIGAVINAVTGGYDYSNGATMWDGQEQAMFSADNTKFRDKIGGRSVELHKNTMGWTISDADYSKWKANVGKGFKAPQTSYTPTGQGKFNRYYQPNTIYLKSTAVYGGTIFWKELKGKSIIRGK